MGIAMLERHARYFRWIALDTINALPRIAAITLSGDIQLFVIQTLPPPVQDSLPGSFPAQHMR